MLNSLKGFIMNAQKMLPVTGAARCQQFFDMASRLKFPKDICLFFFV